MPVTLEHEPWKSEPNQKILTADGYQCFIRRTDMGHLCGYVAITKSHPFFGANYDARVKLREDLMPEILDVDRVSVIQLVLSGGDTIDCLMLVHGGITYSEHIVLCDDLPRDCIEPRWWFGFDCAHCNDLSPYAPYKRLFSGQQYRDMDYVTVEVQQLAKQLRAIEDAHRLDASAVRVMASNEVMALPHGIA